MLHESQLREALISAFQNLQKQNQALHSLTTELAAVRDVLCEHGQKYDDLLTSKRARYVAEAAPLVADDFQKFEKIIQQLRAS